MRFILAVTLFCFLYAGAALSEPVDRAPGSNDQAAPLSEGEVRRVDKVAGKITIRHGPLVNLDMPAMTMVFQVSTPAMLEGLAQGDRIRFIAEKAGGAYRIRELYPVQ